MAEQDEQLETEVELDDDPSTPEDRSKATEHGWSPKDKFRGDPARWVDAHTFLERADTVMPLLKKQKQELEQQVAGLRQQDAAREVEMRSIKAALKAVEESQEEDLAERVLATRADLEEQMAAASEAGDHRRSAKLMADLAELIAADKIKAQKPAEREVEVPKEAPVTPEHRSWMGENSDWYGQDKDKTRTAIAFGQVIAAEGKSGAAFYTELDKRLTKYYGDGGTPRGGESKVEGGRPAGGGGGGSGADEPKGYADLPKEAKDACSRLERKMVGEGKPHKELKSWRASYAKQYHAAEA